MSGKLKQMKKGIASFFKNREGSDSLEFVWTTAMLCTFILVALLCLTYVMELNTVNFATKKVVREIETTGVVNQARMDQIFGQYVGRSSQIRNKTVTCDKPDGTEIPLTRTFWVVGSCIYDVPLIKPGNFDGFTISMPIASRVGGMSEVYFRTSP